MAIVGAEYCDPEERVLTVRKTSHFSPRDVFVLKVSPGFDAAFAMGIVLVLDQIAGDEPGADAGADALDAKIW